MPFQPPTREQIDDMMTYKAPTVEMLPKFAAVREAAIAFAQAIADNTPCCPDQSAAIRLVREARATANAAIALEGRF